MKNRKSSFLRGALCALALCALWLWTSPPAAAVENPFTDVNDEVYYADAVLWAYEKGVTGGTTATTFSPAATCTRGQVVTFLWRAAGKPEPKSTKNPFTDVSPSQYFYKAVLWAVEQGITNGVSDTSFAPGNPCTYAHVITFLWRANGQPEPEGHFNDYWYSNAGAWAYENGYLTGGVFEPGEPCPRANIVLYLYRNQTGNTMKPYDLLHVIARSYILGESLETAFENGAGDEWMSLFFLRESDGENDIPCLDGAFVEGTTLAEAVVNGWGEDWIKLYYVQKIGAAEPAGPDLSGSWLDEGDGEGNHFSEAAITMKDGVQRFQISYKGGYRWYFEGVWDGDTLTYENCVYSYRDEIQGTDGYGTIRIDGNSFLWIDEDGESIRYYPA